NVATGAARDLYLGFHPEPNIGMFPGNASFAPDGKHFAILGGQPGVVQLIETATGQEVRRVFGHPGSSRVGQTLSPGGKVRAVLRHNNLFLWDAARGRPLRPDLGPQGPVQSLSFSADGRTLATADVGTVRLWDAATGKQLRRVAVDKHWESC